MSINIEMQRLQLIKSNFAVCWRPHRYIQSGKVRKQPLISMFVLRRVKRQLPDALNWLDVAPEAADLANSIR